MGLPFLLVPMSDPAQSPFWARRSVEAARKGPKDPKERRHREPGASPAASIAQSGLPFSLQPERVMRATYTRITCTGKANCHA